MSPEGASVKRRGRLSEMERTCALISFVGIPNCPSVVGGIIILVQDKVKVVQKTGEEEREGECDTC